MYQKGISNHSLRVEGDDLIFSRPELGQLFQSTPSVWRETEGQQIFNECERISIHSLRVEGDGHYFWIYIRNNYISIHSLRVEGDDCLPRCQSGGNISIHSLRVEGDRPRRVAGDLNVSISIHSLRVEGDRSGLDRNVRCAISIHSLRVEGDCPSQSQRERRAQFQSTPSVWRETATV